jgi:hypothetical protein
MSNSTRNDPTVMRASIAHLNYQSMRYTDSRYEELRARITSMQVTLQREAKTRETARMRAKFTDRMAYVILAAVLAIVLDHVTGIPKMAVIGIGTVPEATREIYEFLRRL